MTPLHEAVLAVLDGGGGLFFRMLADRAAALLPESGAARLHRHAVAAAIWDLVWAGRLTNDTLAPLRTVLGTGRPVADAGLQRHARAARRAGGSGLRAGPGTERAGQARMGWAGRAAGWPGRAGQAIPAGCRCPAGPAAAAGSGRAGRARAGWGWPAAPGRPR